jgi:hypothetical protein
VGLSQGFVSTVDEDRTAKNGAHFAAADPAENTATANQYVTKSKNNLQSEK